MSAAPGTPSDDDVLSVSHIGVALAGRTILDDVSFSVRPGEFTGLIGSNGAGKTTLLRVILGLQHTTTGRVHIEGQSRRHRSVGYVPQKVQLDPDLPLRARDLVELGIDGHRFGVPTPSRVRRARVQEMVAAVHAEDFADSRVGRLSGGEQQRILIAHALISRPKVLLLDEPLANLDLRSAHDIVALLHQITTDQGVAVLLSAHEMNPLLPVMDRVVYLAQGRAATGSTEQVITSEVLSALYGQHVDVIKVHGRVLVVVGTDPSDSDAVRASTHRSELNAVRWLFERGFFDSPQVHVALVIGGVSAVVSAAVGVFTVVRGQSFAGHALTDASATGGSGSVLIGVNPLLGFILGSVAGAGAMEAVGVRHVRDAELATGIVLGASIGLASLFLFLTTSTSATSGSTQQILFGSIFVTQSSTIPVATGFSVLSLGILTAIYRPLLLDSVSSDIAAARGVPTRVVGMAYMLSLSLAVGLSSLAIGAILSTALLIGPAAAALRLTKRLGSTLVVAGLLGVGTTWLGILLAYDSADWGSGHDALPVSFFIVALIFLAYLISGAVRLVAALHRDAPDHAPVSTSTTTLELG